MSNRWTTQAGITRTLSSMIIAVEDLEALGKELRVKGVKDLFILAQASDCSLVKVMYWVIRVD